MKNKFKFPLIVLLIGLVITIVAVSLGGKIINLESSYDGKNISESYEGVKALNIDLNFSEAEIKLGDEFKIEASNVSKNTFESYVENGKWYIKDTTMSRMFNIINYRPKVTIYIPEGFKISSVNVNIGAGQIVVDKLVTDNISINVGAGEFKIYDLITDEATIDCGVGNIEVTGKINYKGNIKCGIGDVSLNLIGNEKDYDYDMKVGVGEVSLNDIKIEGSGDKIINNDCTNNYFKLDCGIGQISLNIK